MHYPKVFLSTITPCLALVLTACKMPEPDVDEPMSAPAQNEELARQYVEAYNAQDLDSLAGLLAPSITINGEEETREDFLALVQSYMTSFPDLTLEPTHIVGASDYVMLRMEFSGTGVGEMHGHDIDGREIHSTEIILFGVRNGQLAEYWYNWDELAFWE